MIIHEDDPELFFRRPPPWSDSEILRWEICVEALCEITCERYIRDSTIVHDDE